MGDNHLALKASEIQAKDGVALVETNAQLTRLHYFDGKFLRADALTLEQEYHRMLVRQSALAGGWGVVHGLGIELSGARLIVTAGLAITPAGSIVKLDSNRDADVAKLLELAAPARPASTSLDGDARSATFGDCDCREPAPPEVQDTGIFEVTVGPTQALCGREEVYGKLCEDACVTDSQRPYWREGLMLRLRPVTLALPDSLSVPMGPRHLRNRIASGYFAYEPGLPGSLISAGGLESGIWCRPAALYSRDEVPIGLLVRDGASARFVDAWSARRELMDTQARGYWQGRMMMRPWNVYIAQILQFQCQLSSAFDRRSPLFDPRDDECAELRKLLEVSVQDMEIVRRHYDEANRRIVRKLGAAARENLGARPFEVLGEPMKGFERLTRKWSDAKAMLRPYVPTRMLLNAGFVQLPSAGYLPVVPARGPLNDQLQNMFGEGVNLHFCAVRPDYVAHALEEAQHMDRISLVRGLDDPQCKEDVEIMVPCGEIVEQAQLFEGTHWLVDMAPAALEALAFVSGAGEADSGADGAGQPAGSPGKAPGRKSTLGGLPDLPDVADELHEAGRRAAEMMARVREALEAQRTARAMSGVARSAGLNAGGATLTMVCAARLDERATLETRALSFLGLYLHMRVAEDPFAKPEGEEIDVEFEMRTAARLASNLHGNATTGRGSLLLESRYRVDAQIEGANATLRLFTRGPDPMSGQLKQDTVELPVFLSREGDARAGRLRMSFRGGLGREAAAANWTAKWSGVPREAIFGPSIVTLGDIYQPRPTGDGFKPFGDWGSIHIDPVSIGAGNFRSAAGAAGAEEITPVVMMREASAPIAHDSRERLDAVNALSVIAEATDNSDAFLQRALRRLFPEERPTGPVRVRAKLDWVMFRRLRRDCGYAPPAPQPVELDEVEAWHIAADNAVEVERIQRALDTNDAAALKKLGARLQRVNVMHYAGGAIAPNETASHLAQAWQAVNPAPQVALGRTWPGAVGASMGWSGTARLKRLTELVANVIAPPPNTALGMLSQPPVFADARFDGGMILVTVEAKIDTLKHRVAVIPSDELQAVIAELQANPPRLNRLNKYGKTGFLLYNRATNVVLPDELPNLKGKLDAEFPGPWQAVQARVDAASPYITAATPQHVEICRYLGTTARDVVPIALNDFGGGAFALTVLTPRVMTPVVGPAPQPVSEPVPEPVPRPPREQPVHNVLFVAGPYEGVLANVRRGLTRAMQDALGRDQVLFDPHSNKTNAREAEELREAFAASGGRAALGAVCLVAASADTRVADEQFQQVCKILKVPEQPRLVASVPDMTGLPATLVVVRPVR